MPEFENVGIVGLGLLGGSLGLAIKKRKVAGKVLGWTRTAETIIKAEKSGIIDKGFTSFQEIVKDANFLILCAPVFSNNKYVEDVVHLKPGLLFTDIGSTKATIVQHVDACFSNPHNFVGSHPIAGSEKKGIDFADADMFNDKTIVLTPGEKSSPSSFRHIEKFWKSLGGKTIVMDAGRHDELLAYTSHLPHSIIFALCRGLKREIDKKGFFVSIGSGLRDTTRIAGSDARVWTEIFIDNRDNVLSAIEGFKTEIDEFIHLLQEKDENLLEKYMEEAKNVREIIEKNGQKRTTEKS
ncbi:MAG: prephenate dehydrogenase/arogenate dehydrogenase family protein [Candidatus Omnitrophica bacterium]|nr:prephenate dehydrogenase/arogenate dehydrogenase family protein [Candidatus Omnitrophota bacterium]